MTDSDNGPTNACQVGRSASDNARGNRPEPVAWLRDVQVAAPIRLPTPFRGNQTVAVADTQAEIGESKRQQVSVEIEGANS
jgi:hypothetical protein